MNIKLLALPLWVAAVIASSAHASDGTVNFNGSINTTTCDTQDVNMYLGLHQTSEFTGVGSMSRAVVSSIELLNCPNAQSITEVDYRIDPTLPAVDLANNIIAISPTNGAIAAATGVGVKVTGVATSQGPFALSTLQKVGTIVAQGNSVSIPIVARYIQTTADVGPGPANATATFFIDYK
ncbi:fimbrial protein [Pseudomonas sp. L1(2025)]|uniref:fimbrial protein n=1 Tax=Pseudomonas sp. L1(2025) TaxID=3449429 RepID=UPI003F68BEF1